MVVSDRDQRITYSCDVFIPNDLLPSQPATQHGLILGYYYCHRRNLSADPSSNLAGLIVGHQHYCFYIMFTSIKPIHQCGQHEHSCNKTPTAAVNFLPQCLMIPTHVGLLCKQNCMCQINSMTVFVKLSISGSSTIHSNLHGTPLINGNSVTGVKILQLRLAGQSVDPTSQAKLFFYDRTKLHSSDLLHQQYYPMVSKRQYQLGPDTKLNFIEFLLLDSNFSRSTPQSDFQAKGDTNNATNFGLQWKQAFDRLTNISIIKSIGSKVTSTATGRHFWKRSHDISNIYNEDSSLRRLNLISCIVVDVILGLMVTWLLLTYAPPTEILVDAFLGCTNVIVNKLQSIVHWLMGMPAGLKLNRALNGALGHFFLYHIYLWKTYIVVIMPIFALTLESFVMAGVLGVTCQLSLLSDLLSLATIHVYCFYGYAARLYNFEVSCLCSLWRLFRGKKWNPLRNRVDSYAYSPEQLFIGTLTFTILLFLMPTVFVYYLVFTVLRLVVLIIQGVIHKAIYYSGSFPAYAVLLLLVGSDRVNGEVQLIIMPKFVGECAKFKLKISQAPRERVISWMMGDSKPTVTRMSGLSWGELLHNLIWGIIIYPL